MNSSYGQNMNSSYPSGQNMNMNGSNNYGSNNYGSNNYGSSGPNMNMNGRNMNMNGSNNYSPNMNMNGRNMNMNGSNNYGSSGQNNQVKTGECIKGPDGIYRDSITGYECTPPKSSWNPLNWLGGRRRRTVRRGGGVRPYTDINSASTASRFSGSQTAQPHQWTGGRKRRKTKGKRRSFKCKKCSKRTRHRH
jgi:hypothetical protein